MTPSRWAERAALPVAVAGALLGIAVVFYYPVATVFSEAGGGACPGGRGGVAVGGV